MIATVPAGRYVVDPTHTSVTWRIKHFGLAWYTGRFARMTGALDFDPGAPERMTLDASVELASVRTDYDGPAGDWDAALANREDLLDGLRHPAARFVSTRVGRTGKVTAEVEGDLTLRGHTRPILLAVTYNGGLAESPQGKTLIGFSATGTILRSAFGLTFFAGPLLPNEIQLIIETELELEV